MKRLEREVEYLPASSAEVKNERSFTSTLSLMPSWLGREKLFCIFPSCFMEFLKINSKSKYFVGTNDATQCCGCTSRSLDLLRHIFCKTKWRTSNVLELTWNTLAVLRTQFYYHLLVTVSDCFSQDFLHHYTKTPAQGRTKTLLQLYEYSSLYPLLLSASIISFCLSFLPPFKSLLQLEYILCHFPPRLPSPYNSALRGHNALYRMRIVLFLSFRRVLNVICSFLGNSPVYEFYLPTFRNSLSVPSS